MSEIWTIRKLLAWTTQHFEKRGVDAPRLTTEVLLAHVLKTTRVRLYVDLDRPLDKAELTAFRALIERRMAGEPTQYLTGVREFYNRPFKVDPRVLIPRPETELLVEAALHRLPKDAPGTALDVCTGSGCIAISLAAERPQATVLATDLSPDACALARENAQALGVAGRVTVLQGDLYAPLPPDARFDVVVSNPPYIATGEIPTLSAEVRREPHLALDGGPDGLVLIRKVIEGARRVLKPGGLLAMEIGETQGAALQALLQAAGFEDARVEKDLERRDRLAFGTQPVASQPQG
jgi:release factor glutamine methyltransferase